MSMADISVLYPAGCIPVIVIIGALFLAAFISRAFCGATQEKQRTTDYNTFIATEQAWQRGEVSSKDYHFARSEFYRRHPDGDVSY